MVLTSMASHASEATPDGVSSAGESVAGPFELSDSPATSDGVFSAGEGVAGIFEASGSTVTSNGTSSVDEGVAGTSEESGSAAKDRSGDGRAWEYAWVRSASRYKYILWISLYYSQC